MSDIYGRLPLTPMQEGMIFDSIASKQSAASRHKSGPRYLSVIHFRLPQPWDSDELHQRWYGLAKIHPALRTRFFMDDDGRLTQAFPKDHLPGFNIKNISGPCAENQEQAIEHYLEAVRIEGIDPFTGPLCRLVLFDRRGLETEIRDIGFIFHHAVLDGWSLSILMKQLLALENPVGKWVPFSRYLRFLAKRDIHSDLAYWHARLEGVQADCRLPGPNPIADQAADSTRLIPEHHRFSLRQSTALYGLARQLRISPGRLLHALWAVLLCRYNDGRTVFGNVITGRMGTVPGVMEMVGMCVNTIPASLELPEEKIFSAWIREWNTQVSEDERHGFVSPTALNKMIPHYADSLFVVDPGSPADGPEWVRGYGEAVAGFAAGFELAGTVQACFSYDSQKYTSRAVARTAVHFCNILAAVIENPDIALKDISFLPDEESALLLDCDPSLPTAGNTLIMLWQNAAAAHLEKIALVCGSTRMTYQELAERVDSLAEVLIYRGLGPGNRVALKLNRSHRIVIAVLAILKAGAAYLPLAPEWPDDRIRQVLADTRPDLVLDEASFDRFTHVQIPRRNERVNRAVLPEDPAYIIMTSGTTGRPKGVVVEHRNAVAFCTWAMDRYQWGPDRRAAIQTEFAYDVAIWGLYPALFSGATVHILEEKIRHTLHRIRDYLIERCITHMDLPVAMAEEFMDRFPGSKAPPSLRFLATGGDALGRYTRVPYTVVNEYGPTECTVTCTSFTLSRDLTAIPIGKPLPGMRAHILDRMDRLAPLGVSGELCFSGIQVARGYLGDDLLTSEKFIDNPFFDPNRDRSEHQRLYRTGDRACWQETPDGDRGDLVFLGRIDKQVKVRGFRVELGEIESVLQSYTGINRAVAALHTPTSGGEKRLTAWVVCPSQTFCNEDILGFLSEKLPAHMIPALIRIDALPLTPGGKIDLRSLPEPDGRTKEIPVAAPDTPAEKVLLAVLADLLSGMAVNVLQSFLAAGGDSINAIRLAARLESQGWQVALLDIIASPTLRVLAGKMTALNAVSIPDAKEGDYKSVRLPLPDDGFCRRMEATWGEGTIILPPTPTQKMLLTQAAISGPAAYAVAGHYRLPDTAPSPDEIRNRLALAMERHDILRACFTLDGDGTAWMVVPPRMEIPFIYHDKESPQDLKLQLTNRLEATTAGLDPAKPPLVRLELFRMASGHLEMLLHYHHLILDGWSLGILFDELFGNVPASSLPALPFRNYLQWVHAQKSRPDFWDEKFPAHTQPANLPVFPARHTVKSDFEDPERIQSLALLSGDEFMACKMTAHKAGTTPGAFFMAIWALILRRYANCPDQGPMMLGFVSAGRPPLPGIESLVGMCARTLPVSLAPAGDQSFTDFASVVQEQMDQVQARYDVPDTMVGRLPRHLFAFEAVGTDNANFPRHLSAHGSDGYDLVILFRDGGADSAAGFRFNPRAVPAELVDMLRDQFRVMVKRVVKTPDLSAGIISRLPAKSVQQLTEQFGRGRYLPINFPTAVHAFRAAAGRYTDLPALACGEISLTYGALDARTDDLASRLTAMGAGRGCVIGAVMSRSLAGAAVPLAIMKAGAAYLPLAPDWPVSRINDMLSVTDASLLVTDCLDASDISVPTLVLTKDFDVLEPAEKGSFLPDPSPNDLAYVICTSGSTGRPKATAVPHRALANQVAWSLDRFGLCTHDQVLHTIAFSFDPSLWLLFPFWAGGACLRIVPGELLVDSAALMAALHRFGVTRLVLPTRVGDLLFDHARKISKETDGGRSGFPRSMVSLFVGGESPQRLMPVDFEVINAYGPTETCIQVVTCQVSTISGPSRIIGRPLANVQVYVVDKSIDLCPVGVAGELCISGPQLAAGYLGMPGETARVFLDNPFSDRPGFERIYKTGDRVRWLTDGNLEFLGRADDQIKVRGYRIEIEEIRQVLIAAPGIRDAHVLVQRDQTGQPSRLDAYYIPRHTSDSREQIRAFLTSRLPAYMVPSSLTPVRQWPLNAHGKLDRDRLPEPHFETVSGTPPQTEAEKILARSWQTVLGISNVCREDNFFDLGGHSLQLLNIMGHVADTHSIELQDFFKTPKLSDLAARMRPVGQGAAHGENVGYADSVGGTPGEDKHYQHLVAAAARFSNPRRLGLHKIMITGATGYLGAFLLKEYQEQTTAEILVPVRGEKNPRERLHASLAFYFGRADADRMLDQNRIIPVTADLSRSQDVASLTTDFPRLDMILHSAAAVNHYGTPELLTAANVTATEHLLELAGRYKYCRFIHISTLSAVNLQVFSELTQDMGPIARNLYARTKQTAEKRVLRARARGLDCLIFRTGNLILDTVNHRFPQAAPRNMFLRMARMIAKTGLALDGTGKIGPAFVDQAARAIRLLADLADPDPGVFHIDNPNRIALSQLLSMALPKTKSIRRLAVKALKGQLQTMGQAEPGDRAEAARQFLAWIGQQEREIAEGEIFSGEIRMELTLTLLENLGFTWPKMTRKLAESVLKRALTLDEGLEMNHVGKRTG
nr:non-ribosomal peptide synthetase [uncultured Desulfobacter sp.]